MKRCPVSRSVGPAFVPRVPLCVLDVRLFCPRDSAPAVLLCARLCSSGLAREGVSQHLAMLPSASRSEPESLETPIFSLVSVLSDQGSLEKIKDDVF